MTAIPVRLVTACLLAAVWAGSADAGSVHGKVLNDGTTPPAAIPNAMVQVRTAAGALIPKDPVPTNGTGTYTIKDLPNGTYTIIVVKVGFVPSPHDVVSVALAGDGTAADDVHLWEQKPANATAYYATVAENVYQRTKASSEDVQTKQLAAQWNQYKAMNVLPSSLVMFCSELNKKTGLAAKAIPALTHYLESNPEDVRKVEKAFADAVGGGNRPIPSSDTLKGLNVRPKVIADVAFGQLASSSESAQRKEALATEFKEKWRGTGATEAFIDNEKVRPLNGRSGDAIKNTKPPE